MSDTSPMLDDEVEEGSPMGGGTCEDSSPEPMIQPSVEYGDEGYAEQNEENHFPFDSLAVELYEAPDEENAPNNTVHEKTNVSVTEETYGNQNVPAVVNTLNDNACNTQESARTESILTESSKTVTASTVSENITLPTVTPSPSTIPTDSYQPSVEMKEDVPEPDYKELQKTYINDFYYSNVTPSLEEPCDTEEVIGLQLSRFNKIVKAVEISDYETLQTLYQLLYQRSAWDTQEILSQRILGFSGFNFGKNSEDYFNREMMLRTLPDHLLVKIATIIGIDQINMLMLGFSKSKMDLISRILEFLTKPQKKTRGPRTGGAEDDGAENASGNQSEKCGCRHRCLLKFSTNDKKNLTDFLQILREKRMFDAYIISLMTCKKIDRKPSEDYKKLKEVLYTYKVKMANKEINACKGGFCLLHGIKMGKLNQLQNKLKTGKKLPTKLKAELLPPIPASEIPDLGETSGVSKVIKRPNQSPAKVVPQEDQTPKEPSMTKIETKVNDELKEKINLKETTSENSNNVKDEAEENLKEAKTKLKDFSLVISSIEKAPEELLIDIHFLLFLNSADVDKVKDNILEFSGFSFDIDTEEYDERNEFLQRMSNKIVADVARSFSLAVMPKKEDTIKNVLSFLRKPDESYLRTTGSVPVILSDVELDDIDGMSDSDESITCEVVEKKVECIDLISSGEDSDKEEKSGKERSKAASPKKKTTTQSEKVSNDQKDATYQPPQPKPAECAPSESKTRCLRDFETICKIVNTHPHEYLVDIFDLLYMKKHEPSTLRNDILDFSGFTFEKGSSEYIKRKQLLDRMLYNSVRRIYNTLIHNTTEVKVFSKPTMIGEIFQFLFKLPDTDTSIKHIQNKLPAKPAVIKNTAAKSTSGSTGIAPVPVPPTSVPQGKLSDLKRVFQRVACFPCEYLIDVHKLLYMTDCDSKVIRQNIFGFKGFAFSADSPEFQQRKMYLEYLTFHSLRKISSVLTTRSVDLRNSTKHELATHLTQVLAEYTNTYVETEPLTAPTPNPDVHKGNAFTASTASDIENIVITPILEPLNSSPPATPVTSEATSTISSSSDANACNSTPRSTSDDSALSISIVDARSVMGTELATSVTSTSPVNTRTSVTSTSSKRKKRKQNFVSPKQGSTSKQSPRKQMKIAPLPDPNQFADINLPEIEQYRKLYGQSLNIYAPTMPTVAGLAAFNSPGVVQQPFSHIVPQTLPFPLMHSYQPSMQVQNVQTGPVLGIQPQLEKPAIGKQNEVVVPGTVESDNANVAKASSEISLTPEEKKNKISLISENTGDKEDEEDCDKPLSSLIGHPIDSVLKKQILDIVKQTDLQDITINGVIQKIYSMYPKFDLSYRKEFIKSTLRSILYRLGDQNASEKSAIRETNSPDCSVTTTNIPDNTPEDSELISNS